MTTVKVLLNSVICTNGAKFMRIDLKDFYLNNTPQAYKYILVLILMILEDIFKE